MKIPYKSTTTFISEANRVPQTSSLDSNRWIPFLVDEPRESCSYVLPWSTSTSQESNWTTRAQLDEWFDALHPSKYQGDDDASSSLAWADAYYKGTKLLRKTAWCTFQDGCECDYGYSDTWQTRVTASSPFHRTVEELTQVVRTVTGCPSINSCNLNYYPRGGGVGFHADDEFLFDSLQRPTCIISLSLCRNGGARKFLVKEKDCSEDQAQDQYYPSTHERILRHGDLMTMEGMFQKHYYHSVWPGDSKEYMDDPYTQGERINLTWRTIVQHLDGSPECRDKVCPLATTSKSRCTESATGRRGRESTRAGI
jgi:alkylated DNA repair dioxygenase AlkB